MQMTSGGAAALPAAAEADSSVFCFFAERWTTVGAAIDRAARPSASQAAAAAAFFGAFAFFGAAACRARARPFGPLSINSRVSRQVTVLAALRVLVVRLCGRCCHDRGAALALARLRYRRWQGFGGAVGLRGASGNAGLARKPRG